MEIFSFLSFRLGLACTLFISGGKSYDLTSHIDKPKMTILDDILTHNLEVGEIREILVGKNKSKQMNMSEIVKSQN
jgi:hypothetical protein